VARPCVIARHPDGRASLRPGLAAVTGPSPAGRVSSTACPVSGNGLVISTSPAPGIMADIGSQVVLTVCSQMVAVPNVLGRQQGDAESIITGAGLTVPAGKTASGKPCVFR
jgi:beta-lactam-binding protein with PASTA domain